MNGVYTIRACCRLVAENPWQLKPQPPPASAQMSSSTSSSADEEAIPPSAAAFSSDDARPEAGTDSAQYNKVIISINAEPSDRKGGQPWASLVG